MALIQYLEQQKDVINTRKDFIYEQSQRQSVRNQQEYIELLKQEDDIVCAINEIEIAAAKLPNCKTMEEIGQELLEASEKLLLQTKEYHSPHKEKLPEETWSYEFVQHVQEMEAGW